MDKLKSFFDDFVFQASVMPVLTAMFPVIVLGIFKGLIYKSILDTSIYVFVILIFLTFAAKVARECGKRFENAMYRKLGAAPATIVMRYADSHIDEVTKTRYHKILNKTIEGIDLPLSREDENETSDSMYGSAMSYLSSYADANRDTESVVYQELKEYIYWRNIYGCKWFSVAVYVFTAVREVILNEAFSIKEMFVKPYPEYVAVLLMLMGIVVMCACVKKGVVRRKAFNYAKALAGICERL